VTLALGIVVVLELTKTDSKGNKQSLKVTIDTGKPEGKLIGKEAPVEKTLADLLQPGTTWAGTFKFRDDDREGGIKILVTSRDGEGFSGVHVARKVDHTTQGFAVPVQGTVQGNDLNYQPVAPSDLSGSGKLQGGKVALLFENTKTGAKADCVLTLQPEPEKSARLVASWFDRNDDEGWYTLDHDGTNQATGPVQVHQNNINYYLWARDIPNPKEWGWHAPSKYHGDHSGKFGKYLIYDLFTNRRGNVPVKDWYVRLSGAGIAICLTGETVAAPVANQWRSYRFRLNATEGWKKWDAGRGGLVTATNDDIKKVLGDVRDLRIKGEFYASANDGCLDNVEFGADD
jgi:hypothetical protein